MKADLHVHTTYSDGAFPPDRIAALAREAGVALLSMTDHDSLAGSAQKRAAARSEGIMYVSGWEISAYSDFGKVHVLGYGCEENAAYLRFLEERRQGALIRAGDMLQKANARFIHPS